MLSLGGWMDGDRLEATIYDSVMGGVVMEIWLERAADPEKIMIHYGTYDTSESAQDDLKDMFKNVNWR